MSDQEKRESELETLRWLLEFARREKTRLIEKARRASAAAARLNVLYAAVNTLHSAAGRADVIAAVRDIVLNVIGAEQVAVLECCDGSPLSLADGSTSFPEEDITNVIPLRVGEVFVGAIAIGRLRGQKKEFTALDFELFSVLGTHAAVALRVSALGSQV